jgi:hypothetical protein
MFAQKEFACPMNVVRGYCFSSAGSRSIPELKNTDTRGIGELLEMKQNRKADLGSEFVNAAHLGSVSSNL